MCSSTDSVGVTQDTGNSEQAVGATASHELGHIMNMQHDDRGECVCECEREIVQNISPVYVPSEKKTCKTKFFTTTIKMDFICAIIIIVR